MIYIGINVLDIFAFNQYVPIRGNSPLLAMTIGDVSIGVFIR